jgi:hypothetical protein
MLPHCPTLASLFGNRQDRITLMKPEIVDRKSDGHLVRIHLRDPNDLWVIDRSPYFVECVERLSKKGDGTLDSWALRQWIETLRYLKKTGKITKDEFLEQLGLSQLRS